MRRTRFTSVASLTLVAVVFTALCVVPTPSSAIEAKCSACEAVAAELQEALENERPRNHLDMRGRLDSKGIRYGKMIDYKLGRKVCVPYAKVSELRFVELLENLCPVVAEYQLVEGTGFPDFKQRRWEKSRNAVGAKGKAMRAEIEGYCHRVVEEQEEALQAALYAKELNSTNVEDLLCRKFTKECKGKKKKQANAADPAAAEDGADNEAAADAADADKPAKKGGKKGGEKGGKKGGKKSGKEGGAASPEELSSFRESLPKEGEL